MAGRTMGLSFGLERADTCFKRKYRWLLKIDGVCGQDGSAGVQTLPPSKAARPSLSFKEMEVPHLNETLFYPVKPEWKPITLSIFDLKKNKHPVFEWLKTIYNPQEGKWKPSVTGGQNGLKRRATLELYDGCGNTLEEWIFENAWPQGVEFGELDMGSSDLVTADITLRYDRAYIKE